jgi:hypothetical protein
MLTDSTSPRVARPGPLPSSGRPMRSSSWGGCPARSAPTFRFLGDLVRGTYVGEVLSTTLVGSAAATGATELQRDAYLKAGPPGPGALPTVVDLAGAMSAPGDGVSPMVDLTRCDSSWLVISPARACTGRSGPQAARSERLRQLLD